MDYRRVIEQEGYRLEDLTPEHQQFIAGMMQLLSDFQVGYEYETEDEDTILENIKKQIADEVVDDVYSWLEMDLLEWQISAGDSEAVERHDNAGRA